MGISAGLGSLIGGVTQGISSIFSGNSKANAARDAANAQVAATNQGIGAIQGIEGQQQGNQQPFINAGTSSLAQIMQWFQNGTFGKPQQAPTFQGGTFTAPTLQDAQNTPGYQFTAQQGSKGILQSSAAAGGAISGGTLKALAGYNSGLADSTYNNVFNRSLSTYNAGLSKYQADLQGYGAQLQGNQQAFSQLFAPTQLGENAAGNLNSSLGQDAGAIADLYGQRGNAQAAGIVGANNAQWGGVQSGMSQLFGSGGQNINTLAGLANIGGVSNGSGINWTPPPINYATFGGGPGATTVKPPVVGAGPG